MKFLDLFAGIGGFRRGMELAGHECIGFCEFDKYAAASYISMHLLTDEQCEKLEKLSLKQRQKEILKEEYRNGEWYIDDIRKVTAGNIPKADCWCFGAPCQSFSIAGKRAGLDGESGLILEIFRILREIREEDRPEWLIYENVKGMFSSNRGFDFLAILLEMDELGYDIEWQLFNSKNHGVPQNRERVYTVGHLRRCGAAKIFPIEGTDGEDSVQVNQIGQRNDTERCNPQRNRVYDTEGLAPSLNGIGKGGNLEPQIAVEVIGHRENYRRNTQVFNFEGVTEALSTCQDGGREHHTAIPITFGIDKNISGEECNIANTITAREDRGVSNQKQTGTAVAVPVGVIDPQGRLSKYVEIKDVSPTLRSESHENQPQVVLPVLTPERTEKRQNGRRFKENGEPSFTLTGQDRHGVAVGVDLKSFSSKTRGQAFRENYSPTLDHNCYTGVIQEVIGVQISGHTLSETTDTSNCLNANDQRKVFGAKQERTLAGVLVGYNTDDACEHPGIYVQLSEDCTVYAVWYEKYSCYIAIRKLTPRECFRLQGWEDDYFDKAQFVNSDSQMYKQAGNGVTVNVVELIGQELRKIEAK